jgi:hypothetical protein
MMLCISVHGIHSTKNNRFLNTTKSLDLKSYVRAELALLFGGIGDSINYNDIDGGNFTVSGTEMLLILV